MKSHTALTLGWTSSSFPTVNNGSCTFSKTLCCVKKMKSTASRHEFDTDRYLQSNDFKDVKTAGI